MIANIELDLYFTIIQICILQSYRLLQASNEINASLQKFSLKMFSTEIFIQYAEC